METFHAVCQCMSLFKPVIVAVSPNRMNIKLTVQPSKSLKELFTQLVASKLKVQQTDYQKSIIFACSYQTAQICI